MLYKEYNLDFNNYVVGADNSEAKKAAFEIYKQKNENYSKLEDQKQTLKIRYSEAKQLGQKVNDARNKISKFICIKNKFDLRTILKKKKKKS